MFRKITEKLKLWKGRKRRHPLILRGARQVGKTYLVRSFAQFSVPLVDGETLLFLDELQAADPVVLESLRYFSTRNIGRSP